MYRRNDIFQMVVVKEFECHFRPFGGVLKLNIFLFATPQPMVGQRLDSISTHLRPYAARGGGSRDSCPPEMFSSKKNPVIV